MRDKKFKIIFSISLILFLVYLIYQAPYLNTQRFFFPIIDLEGLVKNGGQDEGLKILVPDGIPVRATRAGWVVKIEAETDKKGGSIEIFHPYSSMFFLKSKDGITTIYGNVKDIRVKNGMRVRQGQIIASVATSFDELGNKIPSYLYFKIQKK